MTLHGGAWPGSAVQLSAVPTAGSSGGSDVTKAVIQAVPGQQGAPQAAGATAAFQVFKSDDPQAPAPAAASHQWQQVGVPQAAPDAAPAPESCSDGRGAWLWSLQALLHAAGDAFHARCHSCRCVEMHEHRRYRCWHAPCTMHHVPCTMHHAPCTMHHAPCTAAQSVSPFTQALRA